MAINFDTKKSAEMLSGLLQRTTEVGKNAVENVQKGAVALSEKMKEDSYQWRMKRYNPLFANEYTDAEFVLPQIIIVVDDIIRRGIDVCEGSIGWKNMEGDVEVLYLYKSAVTLRKIQFYPSVSTDSVYYVDSFNPQRYLHVDSIFAKAHEERLAELKNIAHSLGARFCTIEITETRQESTTQNRSGGLGAKNKLFGNISVKAEESSSSKNTDARSGKITAEFEGNPVPQRPKLKWFANDENIKKLIDMRCKGANTLKSETLQLSGSTSATMTHNMAASIDGVVNKVGLKAGFSMESQAKYEHSSQMIFSVEF